MHTRKVGRFARIERLQFQRTSYPPGRINEKYDSASNELPETEGVDLSLKSKLQPLMYPFLPSGATIWQVLTRKIGTLGEAYQEKRFY